MSITLKIVSYQRLNSNQEREFASDLNTFSIGRDKNNQWVLQDPQHYLSNVHCIIENSYNKYFLIDVSTNGVFINEAEEPVPRNTLIPLAKSDRLQLGDYEIEVVQISPHQPSVIRSRPMFGKANEDLLATETLASIDPFDGEAPQRHIVPKGSSGDLKKMSAFRHAETSWLLGIGINRYIEFSSLNNAVKDVEDVIEILTTDYDLSPSKTITLFNEQANEENLIDVLDRLAEVVTETDSLIIYYSGHGHLNRKTGMGFWIPHDAKKLKSSRYIRNSTIRDYLKAIKSRHTLLISDSCFSGTLFVRGASRSSAALRELELIPSRWVICSGRHDEEVYDGEPGKNSPFAESILDVLRSNDREMLNVAKLVDRVVDQTRANYEQLPEGNPIYGVGHKGGQYIFRRLILGRTSDDDRDVQSSRPQEVIPMERLPSNVREGLQDSNARVRYLALSEVEHLLDDSEQATSARRVLGELIANDPDAKVRRRASELLKEKVSSDDSGSPEYGVRDKLTGITIGQQLGPYRIVDLVNEGSTAVVFKAEQETLGRMVTIKVLAAYFEQSSSFMSRFNRGGRELAMLQHPRIVPIYDFGVIDGKACLVMGFMPGGSLAGRLEEGPLQVADTVNIVDQVGEALDFAHQRDVLHRDIRPTSVLFDENGWAYLSNFGLPALSDYQEQLTGIVVANSPSFLAPEVVRGEPATRASDMYALGILVYQMLTGKLPFRHDTPMRVMMAHINEPVPDIRQDRDDLPESAALVLQEALAKDPDSRFSSARALVERLRGAIV